MNASRLLVVLVASCLGLIFAAPAAHADKRPSKLVPISGLVRTLNADAEGLLAYSVRGSDKVNRLFLLDLTGGSARPRELGQGVGPDVANDGSEIVFYNDQKGDNLFWVTTINPKGEGLFDIGVQGKDPTSALPLFAPDGKAIIYANSEGTYIIPRDGGYTRRITTTVVADASWSPDGKQLLFVRKGGGISTLDLVSGISRDLTPNFHGFNPRWAPDGARILYTHELKVYIMDMSTGKRKEVADADRAEWTHSGLGLLLMKQRGLTGEGPTARPDLEVRWVALEGGAPPEDDGGGEVGELIAKRAHEVVVAPDGKTVLLGVIGDGIYKVRLDALQGEKEAGARARSVRQSAATPAAALPKAPAP